MLQTLNEVTDERKRFCKTDLELAEGDYLWIRYMGGRYFLQWIVAEREPEAESNIKASIPVSKEMAIRLGYDPTDPSTDHVIHIHKGENHDT